jgi:phage gp36-like protein
VPGYATIADMRTRYPEIRLVQLTDDDATGTIDEARITRALAQADAEIDGFVAARYAPKAPDAPTPPILTELACTIAYFKLWRNEAPPEDVGKAYDRARADLKMIASGSIKIDLGAEERSERDGLILIKPGRGEFTRDAMAGF